MTTKLEGIDELRQIVRLCDNTRESEHDGYSAEELIKMTRAILASGWDITASDLTEEEKEYAAEHGKFPDGWEEVAKKRFL